MNINFCGIVKKISSSVVIYSLISLLMLSITGCWKSTKSESRLVLINVLDKQYFDDAHIKGSIHIPFEEFEDKMSGLDKHNHYVLYCSNYACMSGPFAAEQMKKSGFDHVYLYPGGIVEWYQKKLPIQGPAQLDYLHETNRKLGEEDVQGIEVLSTEDLKSKMEQFGVIPAAK